VKQHRLVRRFAIRGVFWRQLLSLAVINTPWFVEQIVLLGWTAFFYLVWPPGRRAVADNLGAVLPGSSRAMNYVRVFRVFWNFACTMTDTMHFNERRMDVDWEFEGNEHLQRLVDDHAGAIIITAHMGNYDLGSYLFAERMKRRITIVRVPEPDPDVEEFAVAKREEVAGDSFRVNYNTGPGLLALDLVEALRNGEVVAIQGDRVLPGVAGTPTTLFGRSTAIPTGPFALSMATGATVYPLFIVRRGWRRYRVITGEPFVCLRTGRDREMDIRASVETWKTLLERVVRAHWYQWFTFERFDRGAA
jgi:lauroyl/myristoyl acyltransferase